MVGDVASYTKNEIISILEFFIDNVFVEIGGLDFFSKSSVFLTEQTDPPTMPIFLFTPMRENICKHFSKQKQDMQAKAFNLTFNYIILMMFCPLPTLPEHLSYPTVFKWGSCYSIFIFMCIFCRSLFVLLFFFVDHCVVCSSSIYGF